MKKTLETFCNWLNVSKFPIHPWTNEKTIQNQLGLFLNFWLPRTSTVELEVNTTKLPGVPKGLRKKEADIIVTTGQKRSVIEVKFWRDQGTYNIGMFRCYEDICFVEQLCKKGFGSSAVIFFTDIPSHYTKAASSPNPRNPQNTDLYTTFRYDQVLCGKVQIKTGKLNQSITIAGTYPLQWHHLCGDTCYTIIEIGAK
ncbi:MAG: hypothetical protein EOM20_02465 [Spartobacteria bacterium]|nr:hypothetical protein [Spartobacteria bacterium]